MKPIFAELVAINEHNILVNLNDISMVGVNKDGEVSLTMNCGHDIVLDELHKYGDIVDLFKHKFSVCKIAVKGQ